jgi:hypothetical protein
VFILEYFFAQKSFVVICEAYNNTYADKQTQYTIQLLVLKLRVVVCIREGGGHFQHLLLSCPLSVSQQEAKYLKQLVVLY